MGRTEGGKDWYLRLLRRRWELRPGGGEGERRVGAACDGCRGDGAAAGGAPVKDAAVEDGLGEVEEDAGHLQLVRRESSLGGAVAVIRHRSRRLWWMEQRKGYKRDV